MASDLPPQQYSSTNAMAKALARYIDCPKKIQSAVKEAFGGGIPLQQIVMMQENHKKKRQEQKNEKANPYDSYNPSFERDRLDDVNKLFLILLENERRNSGYRRKEIDR